MKLALWLTFVVALFTGLVALVRLLPAPGRPFGFLVAAIVFYSLIVAISVLIGSRR